jgi:hypothetical protein
MRRHAPNAPARFYRETLVALLALALLGAALVAMPSTAKSTIGWRGDFETGNFSQWTNGVQAKDPSRVSINSNMTRQGRYAARFEVRSGDNNVAGSGSGERSEVLVTTSLTDGYEGREAYWAWSTYFPETFDSPGGGWNAFTQFHHSGSTGQVNVHFAVNDKTRIGLRVLGGDPSSPVRKDFTLASLERGRWYDFVFHVKWSSNPSVGFVETWVNGQLVVPKTFTPTLYPGQGVYAKQGYYRSAYAGTTVLYHDGMRRGSTYDEVAAEFGSGSTAVAEPLAVTQSIASGSTLSGTTGWYASPAGGTAESVTFSVDGAAVAIDTSAPFVHTLDTSRLANGQHTFRVEARTAGGASASASVVASVANQTTLEVGPLAVAQNLTDGQSVSGTIAWSASPNRSVAKTEFLVNGEVVATDTTSPFSTSLDTKQLANGTFPFVVRAMASDGSTASASAQVTVANGLPNTFWMTQNVWDGIVLAGSHHWTATPSGSSVSKVYFSIDGRRVATERHAPYETTVDTRSLSDGTHRFESRAVAVDGRTVTASATVTVANTVAPQPPPPSTTLGVTQTVGSGQTLSGLVGWSATPTGRSATRVEFSIDGRTLWTERYPPYEYGGDGNKLDTRTLADGSHVLAVKAFSSDGSTATANATVTVRNATAPSPAPGAAPATSTAPSTSPSSTSPAPSAPTVPELVSSILDGQVLDQALRWTVTVTAAAVSRVEFYVDGALRSTERIAPYVFGGDDALFDPTELGKGKHTLVVKGYGTNGTIATLTIPVSVK